MKPVNTSLLQRRAWLARAACGAGLAAFGVGTARYAWAAAPQAADRGRLVVVMLRGALDGLAAVPALGDPAWAALRPRAADDDARFGTPLPLGGSAGLFALHPALKTLHGWYGEGRLLVAHAVASPYRERSHFDAQQLLESGSNRPFEFDTGWLGRGLAQARGRGVALGSALPLALRGADGASSWAPEREAGFDADLMSRVARLYEPDALLSATFARARDQQQGVMADMNDMAPDAAGRAGFARLAKQAGQFLAAADGPTLAWLDATGWDTHTQQAARLARGLEQLDGGLAALRSALGPRWASTTVLVMTEFGRSAAMNGSGGTDHGTAGVAFVAGGAVAGGRVLTDWPGLARAQLHEARDLRPTLDLRALLKPALQRHFGLAGPVIDTQVLPGAPRGVEGLWRT